MMVCRTQKYMVRKKGLFCHNDIQLKQTQNSLDQEQGNQSI